MRITERLQYLAGLIYYILAFIDHTLGQYIMLGIITILLVSGFIYEGIRMHQFPFIIAYLIHGIWFLSTEHVHLAMSIIGLLLNTLSTLLLILFGEVNFNRWKCHGPY